VKALGVRFLSFFFFFFLGGNNQRDVVDILDRLRVRTRQKATSSSVILQFEGKR
jgi:hypothetical protein